ncbi:hypothetical protein [Streptomyces sp. NEAU-174]|uniref:hypothetical protein n=1 Tax=Streptomyces sp. NEAU-174 TaxID=3458254 RepID=UPI004043D647
MDVRLVEVVRARRGGGAVPDLLGLEPSCTAVLRKAAAELLPGDPRAAAVRLGDRALRLSERLAAGPAFALGRTKHVMRGRWDTSRERRGREEAHVISEAVETPEAATMVESFVRGGQGGGEAIPAG